jgi:predicted transcriptional regulator
VSAFAYNYETSPKAIRRERAAMRRVGAEVRRWRENYGMTGIAFAKLLGISSNHLSNIEQGVRKLPLDIFCKATGAKPGRMHAVAGHCASCHGTGYR